MGIDNFFKSLSRAKITNTNTLPNNSVSNNEIDKIDKIQCKRLYMDFISILHKTANKIENDIQYVQFAKIIRKVDAKCREIVKDINPNFDIDQEPNDIEMWCNNFRNMVNRCVTNDYILDKIRQHIEYIMDELIIGETVERIFISIDGIPTMAKIVEQKRRRIMTCLLSGLKKKFNTDFKHQFTKERDLFMNYVYIFDRTLLSHVSSFMDILTDYLTSLDENSFHTYMKVKYPNLEEIIISSHHQPGEGEKKIMEDIIDTNYNNLLVSNEECVIYSPDSDVIILSMLIRNILNRRVTTELYNATHNNIDDSINSNQLRRENPKTKNISKVGLVRHNSYEDTYDYISADDLCSKIFKNVQKRTQLCLDEDRVTNDVSFIFTLFGNDFLPKLEAINIKNDIDTILRIYVQTLEATYKSRHFGMYIIYHSKAKYRINYASFSKYIELLSQIEVTLMKEKYMSNTYRNYKHIKSIFNDNGNEDDNNASDLLYPQLIQYVQFANIMFSTRKKAYELLSNLTNMQNIQNTIDTWRKPNSNSKNLATINMVPYVQQELMNTFKLITDTDQFESLIAKLIRIFVKIEKIKIDIDIDTFMTLSHSNRLALITVELLRDNPIYPKLELIHDFPNVKSYYHQQNIKNKFAHPDMSITIYDEELYMFTRCMNKYKNSLEPEYEIGSFKLSVVNNRYKYDSSYIITDAAEYYKRYIDIDLTNTTYKDTERLNTMIMEYIKGLFWVFDYYVNNRNHISTWFYRYTHTPFLFHISRFIHTMTYTYFNHNIPLIDHGISSIGKKRKYSVGSFKDKLIWMEKIYENVTDSTIYVPREKFMNMIEYYVYVNPYNKLDSNMIGRLLVEELKKVDQDLLFGNINQIIDRIWNGDKTLIDTRYTYLSKGKIIGQRILSYDEWKNILKEHNINFNMIHYQ